MEAQRRGVPIKRFVEGIHDRVVYNPSKYLRNNDARSSTEETTIESASAEWKAKGQPGQKRKVVWPEEDHNLKRPHKLAQEDDSETEPDEGGENAVVLETDFDALCKAFAGLYLTPEAAAKGEQQKADAAEALARLPPKERVFSTTELLENILVHLSPAELIKSQAVCKTFKTCFENSVDLRLKTFRSVRSVVTKVPAALPPLHEGGPWRHAFVVNPMIAEAVPDPPELVDLRLPYGIRDLAFLAEIDKNHPTRKDHDFAAAQLNVMFDRENPLEVEHTGSWQALHLTDPGIPLLLKVCRYRTFNHAAAARGIDLVAKVDLAPCTIGEAIEIAKGADKMLRSIAVTKSPTGLSGLGEYGVSLEARRLMRAPARWWQEYSGIESERVLH